MIACRHIDPPEVVEFSGWLNVPYNKPFPRLKLRDSGQGG